MPSPLPAQNHNPAHSHTIELPAKPITQGSAIILQNKIPDFGKPLYPAPKRGNVLLWYLGADVLALTIGFFCIWALDYIEKNGSLHGIAGAFFSVENLAYLTEFASIAAALLLWFQHTGHYHISMPFWIEARKITSALALAAVTDGFLQYATKQDVSRLWLMSGWAVAAMAMLIFRDMMRASLKKKGRFQIRTLLVGTGETAKYTCDALRSDANLHYEITAQISDLPKAFLQAGHSWETLCVMHGVEYVIVALDGDQLAAAKDPLEQLARETVPFAISPPLVHLPVSGMTPHYFMNHDVMLLTRNNMLDQAVPCFFKRAFDIAVSGTALLLLSPVMIGLAFWVKRDGGPAFYAHMRVGRNKRQFACLKFRSMVMNGDAVLERHLADNPAARREWEDTRKLINDPRITKVGKFLRSSSLDELPQLINVLRGDMSLVGPRPIVNAEIAKYDHDIAHYYRVRPGVTGLWQVSGRSDVSYPRRVHMDSWYVRNWSLWHDIAILCKTLPALLNRTGAY